MKALVVLAGLLIGVLGGTATVLLNPITWSQGRPAALAGAVRSFGWEGDVYRGFDMTPSGLLGLDRFDPGESALKDPAIRYARAEIVTMSAVDGGAPLLAVRLSAIARSNSLLRGRLGIVSNWNILWPGEDSLLAAGSENFWVPLRDAVWSAVRGHGLHPTALSYPLPSLPGMAPPRLIGGRGAFATVRGGFREEFLPDPAAGADLAGSRQLHIAVQ